MRVMCAKSFIGSNCTRGLHRLLHEMRRGAEEEAVPVGRHAGDALGGEDAAGADDVFDHDGALTQHLGELGRHLAREHVGTAAGGKRHDDPDGAIRIVAPLRQRKPVQSQARRPGPRIGDGWACVVSSPANPVCEPCKARTIVS